MKKVIYFLIICWLFVPVFTFGFEIRGKVLNSGNHKYRVSIFHLRTIDDFSILGGHNLVQYTITDSAGHFTIKADFVPEEETIYRIHIKKIEYLRDTTGDAMDSEINLGKVARANYFFLPLKNASSPFIEINNKEQLITGHKILNATSSSAQLYSLLRKFDSSLSVLIEKDTAITNRHTPESKTFIKNKMSDLKDTLYDELKAFIKSTRDPYTAVMAFIFSERMYKLTLQERFALLELIEVKDPHNKYIPSIRRKLEDAKESSTFKSLKAYSIIITTLFLISLTLSVLFFLRYKRLRTDVIEMKVKEIDTYSLLSRKELEILEMLANGLSNKEIAAAQYVELSTVKKHITSIYAKTGIKNRNEAGRFHKKKPQLS
jgi:DNA-binding CsgD family transcriptional regulator